MARSIVPSAVLVLVLAAPAAATAHQRPEGHGAPVSVPRAAPGSGEARLRSLETQALGSTHAREHAEMRGLSNRAERRRANRRLMRSERLRAAERRDEDRSRLTRSAVPRVGEEPVSRRDGGTWDAAQDLPKDVIAINSVLLPTGKVLVFSYPGRPKDWVNGLPENGVPGTAQNNLAHAWLVDPVGGGPPKQVDPPADEFGRPTNIWCSGASLLADGRVVIAGGNFDPDPTKYFFGTRSLFTFDPFSETWTREPDMRQGRWYPTTTLMPDGRALILGGYMAPGDPEFPGTGPGNSVLDWNINRDLEIFSPGAGAGTAGTLELNRLKFANPDGSGAGANGPRTYGQYNRLFWMPSGRVLSAGPFALDTWFLDPKPAGQAWTSTDAPNLTGRIGGTNRQVDREWGTAVLLDGGKVLTMGGSDRDAGPGDTTGADPQDERSEQNTMSVFDESNAAAGWQPRKDMTVGRSSANSVVLPDGKVATLGGGLGNLDFPYYRWQFSQAQKRPEIYDPVTDMAPVLGNPQTEGRTYHSTALLLPDGRVLSAGDDINGRPAAADDPATVGNELTGEGTGTRADTYEIWSPPYLFDADDKEAGRPVIQSAPATAEVGSSFDVGHSGPAPVKAALVSPGAPTHSNDMSQRRVPLAVSAGAGGTTRLTVPAKPNVALPGFYMLFLMDADGVPSVAKWVRITPKPPDPVPPPPPPPPDNQSDPPKPSPVPPKPDPAPKPKTIVLTISTGKLPRQAALRRSGRLTVSVRLTGKGAVQLTLAERRLFRRLATTKKLRFTKSQTRRVTFKLTPAGKRILLREKRVRLRLRATTKLSTGKTLKPVQALRNLR